MRSSIFIKNVRGKGLGVFAEHAIAKGTLLESCPIIPLTPTERAHCEKTLLNHYIYPWKSTRSAAVVLGFGSIYNHSYTPNADWRQNFRTNRMEYRALRAIRKGEEVTVNYNGEPDDQTEIDWFVVR
jgi:SET domain-containing protein